MAKIGKFHKAGVAVPDDHPDGGTIHIVPMGTTAIGALQDGLNGLRYEHDESGALTIVDGKPVEREISIEETTRKRIQLIREICVRKITNLVDADDPVGADGSWKLIELSTPREIEAFLDGVSNHLVEAEVRLTRFVEREIKTESFVSQPDGSEPTRIVETRMAMVEEPVIEGGQPKTEKRMVPANQRMFDYVLDRARALKSVGEAEAKNSSPTPAGISA